MVDRVWYVAYGSNLNRRRFERYLGGGRPVGGRRTYTGSRDSSPPLDDVALMIRGSLYFAGESRVWGGGMAFLDPDADGRVAARAYLLTVEQFSDVVAQEMRRPVGADLDLTPVLAYGRHSYGTGRYDTVVRVGHRAQRPRVTFTAAAPVVPRALPSRAYLDTIAAGIREAHGWQPARIREYLQGCGTEIEPSVDDRHADRTGG